MCTVAGKYFLVELFKTLADKTLFVSRCNKGAGISGHMLDFIGILYEAFHSLKQRLGILRRYDNAVLPITNYLARSIDAGDDTWKLHSPGFDDYIRKSLAIARKN